MPPEASGPERAVPPPDATSVAAPEAEPEDWSASAPAPEGRETIVEAAERVLFASTLEEKLRYFLPEAPLGDVPAGRSPLPARAFEPGRPPELRFAPKKTEKAPPPSSPSLVDEAERGRLLHYFANHELLAAELMALALLRFPETPEAFRRGLARTLLEELRHARWYLSRMEACGVAFGQHPVNGFFWGAVSGMAEPIDYVSRLSLTFEQANLDYSRHYAGILQTAGDPASAAILGRVYRDEIAHVGYGLRWFRRWKEPGLTDWEEHERRLVFPLSPSRAKGNRAAFDKEGRLAAGFGEDYLSKLELFERSTGRVPDVHLFNPEAEEEAAAHPQAHTPGRAISALAGGLELLQAFLARRGDVVLLRQLPSPEHLRRLREHGLALPELEALAPGGGLERDCLLRRRKIKRLVPWSAAPGLERRFGELAPNCDEPATLAWRPGWRPLFSKIEQREALADWFGPSIPVRSAEELPDAMERLAGLLCAAGAEEGTGFLLKRPFSAAGRGQRRLSLAELLALAREPFRERTRREGGFLLEPWHDRVFDFSAQYQLSGGGARLLGFVEQRLSPGGAYRGSLAMPRFCRGLPPETARLLATEALPLYEPGSELVEALASWAGRIGYEGPLGIDAYLHLEGGLLKHRPVCEVNARHTMGRVALELRRRVAPGHGALLETVPLRAGAPLPETAPPPPRLREGRLCGGSLLLTEAAAARGFVARLTVAKSRRDLGEED